MKRTLLVILLPVFILSGCWDSIEIQNLAIITAAAIDSEENHKVKVSVQIFIPRTITSGESGEDPSLGSTFVREGIGKNLAEAISVLQTNIPRKLFWGQCKIFIFGHDLAKTGIRKELDFLIRHPDPRINSNLYVSEGKASNLLKLIPPLERYSGEVLSKFSQHQEVGVDTTLSDISKDLTEASQSFSLPYIKRLKSDEYARKSYETIPTIVGTAIFKKDKMIGNIDLEETRGLLWLSRKIQKSTVSIKPEENENEVIMMPTSGSVRFKPQIINNQWIMNIQIQVAASIIQNETFLSLLQEDVITKLEKGLENKLRDRISKTLEKIQKEYQADVVGFGRRFHQKYPEQWKKVKDHWDEKFPEVDVKLSVNATIKRSGDIGGPAALPEEEVIEN
ncbi:Ger(x)C family spore germination protein [Pallidibacillus thermolactis]|jgi:spore germination protein KC|uniref:Ger(x)C family spore germination protein n=1 Tax=Pallidibacillus thermolactis TaxID=251051 RepID=UPI0021D9FAEE|nr:Ger(x)C family spore germination protein [Pallidibacillus thermolactis]MCU9601999.1 Ger(x)C family spore germination protein [Pallidibacillus thermolactis subsp. kokeshiiformis]